VELASPKLGAALLMGANPEAHGKPQVYHVSTAALVTNLAVHFKHGRESSLVWVTALETGAVVPKAQVSVQDCSGKEHWKGVTDARGVARISKTLPDRDSLPGCLSDYDRQFMVFARAGRDVSFVLSSWDEGISRWRFNLPAGSYTGPYIATTVFDRTLLRAGDTVHMKLLYRQHTRAGLRFVDRAALPAVATIEHQGSEQRYELPLKWDARNSAELDWKVPRDAKTGVYRVRLEDALAGRRSSREAGTFRVEEFRVPLMRAGIEAPQRPLVNATSAQLGVQVSYLAGGGAAFAPVKLRSVVQPRVVSFPGYDEFTLANGAVREGVQADRRADWYHGEYLLSDEEAEAPAGTAAGSHTTPLKTLSFDLDSGGGAKVALEGLPRRPDPQELVAELEYADPNGELLTTATRIPLWPAALVVGLKPDSWALSQDKVKLQAVALDLAGKPIAGARLSVDLFERKTFSHRKRLLGGFYAYQSGAEVKRLQQVCEGRSDARGLLFCEFAAPVSGELLVEVRAADADGNVAVANTTVWVAGQGEWWFDVSNDDRMDVLPERKRYEPGETAVFQVRMPFRQATALVTVEREGVMDVQVVPLSGKAPAVKVPVLGNHAPNVFVSVLAVRGRVAGVQPTALVDLGKPAFRMGVAQIDVGWRAHELKVAVSTDRAVYRVRERARVSVQVLRARNGKPPPKGSEVALAAVDEGLLELMPNQSWKLLETMMQRRGIEVETATASMQVVGKRHYGRKAREAGGGGGRKTSRELFDTLLFWKARVKLDANGRAVVDVPLNDSLTSFRIVAVADGGADLFGTGSAVIRSTQELMLFSGLPPLVREQDSYRAAFTIRNASEAPLAVQARASLAGETGGVRATPRDQEPVAVTLAPGESKEVGWDAKAPVGVDALRWTLAASAKTAAGAMVEDVLSVTQAVIPAVPVRTFQATLAQLDPAFELPVEIPGDAIPGRGGVQVGLLPRLAGELPGVREFMRSFRYTCLEQLASQAVALRDQGRWNGIMAGLPGYLDRDGFAMYFPGLGYGSDALTVYLLNIANEAGWDIPADSRSRMQSALDRFVKGQAVREQEWRTADLNVRKVAALQAQARWGRAVSDEDLGSVSIEPNLWPTSAVIDWFDLLKRAPGLRERDSRMQEAEQIVRSRLNFQGTTLGFSTERTDFLWWLMISGDVNANRVLLAMLDRDSWKEDMPRLARGSLGRQQRGHWNTTVANAWGVLAMEKFGAAFEKEAVTGITAATLGAQAREVDWSKTPKGAELMFPWPQGPGRLDLAHAGAGKPWAMLQSLAAIPLRQPFSSGYRIKRTVSAVERQRPGKWSRGDVMRVRLDLEAQSDMTWVVVNDPVPAGASVLGTGLGRDSQILTAGEKKQGWVWPAFEERRLDSFRAYYRFVPKGTWTLEYTLRLNNPGEFLLPETRVEALYAPEMFGEIPNATVVVVP
jgi:alpha-2-macroglobulin